MAFIGTPLDTRNTFQSIVGKRFDGDGSTTAFTLDVAPSSTLDIEVFVGNVRQDPNSAYTLSGTTLTFTGAPPSGTNNIYVVHQAKAVGTIGIPDDTISARTLVTLDNSADHVLIEDATDGALKKALIPGASFAGIDDQSSSNDDQLTITDTAVVINEDSDDVDFRVESNGNANMLFVSGGNDVVGIGAEGDLGVGLHIKSADSGASVGVAADELVIEGSGNSGMSILSGTSHIGGMYFADSGDTDIGKIEYDHSDNTMRFTTNDSERMRINGDDFIVSRANNYTNNGTGGGSGVKLSDVGGTRGEIGVEKTGTSAAGMIYFYNGNGNVGGIVTDGSSTSYNTSSDYRLKENEVAISDGITRLKTLKPYRFNFKADKDKTVDGFFAHEVTAVPEAIQGEKDGAEMQSIDQAKLVPLLTSALKEAITKIEALETRVTTLEG